MQEITELTDDRKIDKGDGSQWILAYRPGQVVVFQLHKGTIDAPLDVTVFIGTEDELRAEAAKLGLSV